MIWFLVLAFIVLLLATLLLATIGMVVLAIILIFLTIGVAFWIMLILRNKEIQTAKRVDKVISLMSKADQKKQLLISILILVVAAILWYVMHYLV